jgi:GT2 family glycosyltransferase
VAGAVALADAYLLALLGAAAIDRRRAPPQPAAAENLLVLVPAHDEESMLPELFASLARVDGRERADVVVVADNCTDRTADVARNAGAQVLERDDPARPGKGRAIAWALERLAADGRVDRPVLLVDADCQVSPNILRALQARLEEGAVAMQTDYVAANPEESPTAGLRAAAFALVNGVRPRGRDALGLSCGLLGTGMCFTPALLERVPWRDFGLAEDLEYGLRLVAAGERVVFVPEAAVSSPMPTSAASARDQQLRWEAGKLAAARAWTAPLVSDGVRARDPRRIVAGLETLVPPQSLLLLAHVALAAISAAAGAPRALRLAVGAALAQAAYVIGGLALVRAPAAVWLALVRAPGLVTAKALVALRLALGRGPTRWVRTKREGGQR